MYEFVNTVTTCFPERRSIVDCKKGSHKVKNLYFCKKQSLSMHPGENTYKLNILKKMNIFS